MEGVSKLADWDDDDPQAILDTSSRWDKVVILKHMFTLAELEVGFHPACITISSTSTWLTDDMSGGPCRNTRHQRGHPGRVFQAGGSHQRRPLRQGAGWRRKRAV